MAEVSAQPDGEVLWAKRLSELVIPVLRHRLERVGLHASGAYNFYNVRVQRSELFLNYELELARALVPHAGKFRQVHELGSGFGQLMFLLGWNGFETVGFESDRQRAKTARDLKGILDLVDPELTKNVQLLEAEFPSPAAPRPEAHSLLLTTNLVATRTLAQQLVILGEMRKYPYVLADIQRFFELRLDPAEQEKTLALFARAGFSTPEPFLDLGNGGRYYLFTNSGGIVRV